MARTAQAQKPATPKPNTRKSGVSTTSGVALTVAQAKTHPAKVTAQLAKVLGVVMPIAAKSGHAANYSAALARVYVKAPQGFNPWAYVAALAKAQLPVQAMYRARKNRLTIVVPGGYPTT